MSYKRKYASYKIVVTKKNGEKEEIKFEGISGSSYVAMRDAYNNYKDNEVTNDVVNIDFCGVSAEGTLTVMWNKPYEENNKNETPFDIMNNQLDIIKDYKDNFGNYEQWLNKKMDEFKHKREKIKFLKTEEEKNKERIRLSIEEEELINERREYKNRFEASCMFESGKYTINEINKKWNRELKENEVSNKIYCYREKYNSNEEKQLLIDKLTSEGYNRILQLPNNYIGYYKTIYNNDNEKVVIKINDKTEENLLKECNDIKITESTLDTNCIKTITMAEKIPKEMGSCIQIRYKSMKEKMKIIKDQHDKYERCENIGDKNIIRLMYRIA